MVTRQFERAEEVLQASVKQKCIPITAQTHRAMSPLIGGFSEVSQSTERKNSARPVHEIDEEERNGDEDGGGRSGGGVVGRGEERRHRGAALLSGKCVQAN